MSFPYSSCVLLQPASAQIAPNEEGLYRTGSSVSMLSVKSFLSDISLATKSIAGLVGRLNSLGKGRSLRDLTCSNLLIEPTQTEESVAKTKAPEVKLEKIGRDIDGRFRPKLFDKRTQLFVIKAPEPVSFFSRDDSNGLAAVSSPQNSSVQPSRFARWVTSMRGAVTIVSRLLGIGSSIKIVPAPRSNSIVPEDLSSNNLDMREVTSSRPVAIAGDDSSAQVEISENEPKTLEFITPAGPGTPVAVEEENAVEEGGISKSEMDRESDGVTQILAENDRLRDEVVAFCAYLDSHMASVNSSRAVVKNDDSAIGSSKDSSPVTEQQKSELSSELTDSASSSSLRHSAVDGDVSAPVDLQAESHARVQAIFKTAVWSLSDRKACEENISILPRLGEENMCVYGEVKQQNGSICKGYFYPLEVSGRRTFYFVDGVMSVWKKETQNYQVVPVMLSGELSSDGVLSGVIATGDVKRFINQGCIDAVR